MNFLTFKKAVLVAMTTLSLQPALAQHHMDLPRNYFVALTFHDVRDDVKKTGDRDVYAISTQNLSSFFDWIKVANWTPITLKQLQQAKHEGKDLPENAVLLSFDDGALSSYSRVFPLLRHYNIPAVFAIPTSWINGNTKDAYEAYGEGNLMNWDQMREMQASGLVEFASHTHDMHKGILANPQQNQKAAAITHAYLADQQRYETDEEFTQRVYTDLELSRQILDSELGKDMRAIVWPYGAVTANTTRIAVQAGYPLSFSLGKTVANAKEEGTYQRLLIMDNPTPEQIHSQVHNVFKHVDDPLYKSLRMLSFDLAQIVTEDLNITDQNLGELINQLDVLKSNTLLLDVLHDRDADGRYDTAYYPTQLMPHTVDVLSRASWQAKTRVGQYVMVNLPIFPDATRPRLSIDLATEIVKFNPTMTSISLDTQQYLQCLWTDQRTTQICRTNVQTAYQMQAQIRQSITPYLNISDSYFSSLKIRVDMAEVKVIQDVISELQNNTDFLLLDVDVIAQPQVLQNLLKVITTLAPQQKRKIGIQLMLPEVLNEANIKTLQGAYLAIQQSGIQKFGAAPYRLSQAKQIHQQLYPALSLNSSPVTYRKPNEK